MAKALLPVISQLDAGRVISGHILRLPKGETPLQILEAGCGQRWDLDLGDREYILTGVDLDGEALRIRADVTRDLHRTIVGDLRTVELPDDSYDVIYSSYVLEHISGADKVLENFRKWIRLNGLIIIRLPDPNSVHGFTSRVTPHWFHVFYYRNFYKRKNAGKPGYAPYPIVYDEIILKSAITKWCQRVGLKMDAVYPITYVRNKVGLKSLIVRMYVTAVDLLSFGAISRKHEDMLYVIKNTAS